MPIKTSYVLITSALNEAENISRCIESVLKQSILPSEWIIIDNGSTDNTSEIIKKYATNDQFIKLFYKEKENYNVSGYHAIINFYFGLSKITRQSYDFIGNLDADIILDRADYYEYQIDKMNSENNLGITTGVTYYFELNGSKKLVWHNSWHTTGALKFYRRECFESLGKMAPDFGWDGADEMKAMAKGWKTITFFDLEVNHLGKLRDLDRQKDDQFHFNRGFSIYRRGYPFWYVLIKSFQTLKENSYSSFVSLLKGYWSGLISKEPKILNKEEIIYLNKFQLTRLLKERIMKNDV